MPVLEGSRLLPTTEGLMSDISDIAARETRITINPQDDKTEYTLEFGDQPLRPHEFYGVMRAAAPFPHYDSPGGVIADWKEPDKSTDEAIARIKRHERMLGMSWQDFMGSRAVFLELMATMPEMDAHQTEVRPLTTFTDRLSCAAAYLVHYSKPETAQIMLDNAGVDEATKTLLWDTIVPFLGEFTWEDSSGPRSRLTITREDEPKIAQALHQQLIGLPPRVTEQIVQSTLKTPGKQYDEYTDNYYKSLIRPDSYFTMNYCVQMVKNNDGSVTALPFAKTSKAHAFDMWVIPEWTAFQDLEIYNKAMHTARIVNPSVGGGIRDLADYAAYRVIEAGSMHIPSAVSRVKPVIRWSTDQNGKRELLVEDDKQGSNVSSGIFGLILAAALQPNIVKKWPTEKHGQRMGIAQLPVLALMQREELLNSSLLKNAETVA